MNTGLEISHTSFGHFEMRNAVTIEKSELYFWAFRPQFILSLVERLEVTSKLILSLFQPQTKKAFQKESLSLASIGLMLQPDSNHRDWNPTQRDKDRMIFRKK